jgi:hypothetical protein
MCALDGQGEGARTCGCEGEGECSAFLIMAFLFSTFLLSTKLGGIFLMQLTKRHFLN